MRVLHVAAGNLFGGIETLLVTLARYRELCPEMEPHFALCFDGRLSKELEACAVPVHRLGSARVSRPWTVLRARRRMRTLLREERFDAVVTHGCWPHAIFGPVGRRCGIPVVFWGHGIQSGGHWLERWASRCVPDLVLANSRATERSIRDNLFPTGRGEVLYLPVAAPEIPDPAAARRRVRSELGTPEDAVVILQVSRMERGKGHLLLIESLRRLRDIPGWACWIVGDAQREEEGRYLSEIRRAARGAGVDSRIRFLGHRGDVPELMTAADILCQPNTAPDSFGIVFVEALYAGLPVVTTAIGGATEIVTAECGELTAPGDAGELADALGRILDDPGTRRRLSVRGPAVARGMCDPERQIPRIARLFKTLGPDRAECPVMPGKRE